MESFRDVKCVMERERRKGNCPLAFLRLEFSMLTKNVFFHCPGLGIVL